MKTNNLSHIAFILDGNKRWAKKNNLNNLEGYKKGFENIINIVDYCLIKNIKNITLFTLSSENFKRSSVNIIYEIIYNNFTKVIDEIIRKKNIKIKIFGNRDKIPKNIKNIFDDAEIKTINNNHLNLNLAFNYGFKEEIKDVLKKYKKNYDNINIENDVEINKLFNLGHLSDPDLLIRTGGYQRLSNFIMYNLTYTELFFTETLWPEFTIQEFDKIIGKFLNIKRKYGL